MNTRAALSALVPIDLRSVARDPLLRWIAVYPLAAALLVRWGTPWAVRYLDRRLHFDLVHYYPLLASFVLLTAPVLAGTVIGFLLLDQRDDGTLVALRVTPLTTNSYLVYRISVPMALSFALGLSVLPLTNLIPLSPSDLFLVALAAAPVAPLYALVLAVAARNKVQGFAVSKAMGALMIPVVAAAFVREPWQWLLGLDPLYWPAKLVWLGASAEGQSWTLAGVGLAYEILVVLWLARLFNRRLPV